MKFSLRDDDLNYFYKPSDIIRNFEDIWDICPISMSCIPFVKGNWIEINSLLERKGSNNLSKIDIQRILSDDNINPIHKNIDLVNFIKEKIREERVYITMHGIEHRNCDETLPSIKNNFSIGAEFNTTRDLTENVRKAKKYLEKVFQQKIQVFTPPQNSLSMEGIKAVTKNNLIICGDLPSIRKIELIRVLGLRNYYRLLVNKLFIKDPSFIKLESNKSKFISHVRLQPSTDIDDLYARFETAYRQNNDFVLSTHSYAFGYKMKKSTGTMGTELVNFIDYCSKKNNIRFLPINELFPEKQ